MKAGLGGKSRHTILIMNYFMYNFNYVKLHVQHVECQYVIERHANLN